MARNAAQRLTSETGLDRSSIEDTLDGLFPQRAIKRVLLINPPDADSEVFRYETAKRGRYTNYPPYGLGVLARRLIDIGLEVRICNLNHAVLKQVHETISEAEFDHGAAWRSALDNELKAFRPDFIGITCMFTMTHNSLKKICAHAAGSGVPIGIGGVHVSNDVDRILDDILVADVAFLREGDHALVNFVRVVNRSLPPQSLGQVIVRDPAGRGGPSEIRHRYLAECLPTDSDISLVPAYDLMDVRDYSRYGTIGAFYGFKPKETVFATILSNRGCRAQCTFCSVRNFNGKGVRQRDWMNVVDELQMLVDEYGVGHVMWLDDDLLKDHDRAMSMFNEIVRRGLKITWDATNGLIAASCTEEVVAAMAESGCIAVNIGMESGNPEVLRQVKKPGTIKNFVAAAETFRRYEQIHTSVLLMLGFPGETMGMIRDTINVARTMDCDWYRISPLQPLPNTPIYDAMVAQGLIQDVGSRELRFMGGGFGKQTEIEQGLRLAELGFGEAFASIPLDSIPSKEEITDIWFYMNYHLNFHRLFTESRPEKIRQQQLNLRILSEVISPENGFAIYFLGVLEHRLNGKVPKELAERLKRRLDTSPYWRDRFGAFGLSVGDLETSDFRNKQIPRLLPGGLPFDDGHDGDSLFSN
jgi:radical SAM superfamily enzyme YgiQ (UPF0313 family)